MYSNFSSPSFCRPCKTWWNSELLRPSSEVASRTPPRNSLPVWVLWTTLRLTLPIWLNLYSCSTIALVRWQLPLSCAKSLPVPVHFKWLKEPNYQKLKTIFTKQRYTWSVFWSLCGGLLEGFWQAFVKHCVQQHKGSQPLAAQYSLLVYIFLKASLQHAPISPSHCNCTVQVPCPALTAQVDRPKSYKTSV